MAGIIEWLSGKKSYILAIIAGVFNFGLAMAWWTADNQTWVAVNALLASLFGMTMRAAVSKSGPQ